MSTMHRPKAVNATIGPQIAPWSPSRPGATVKAQTQRIWTLTWAIAAPATAQGELIWTIDATHPARPTAHCVLSQAGKAREVASARRVAVTLINGLTHIVAFDDQEQRAALTVVLDAPAATLLYATSSVLASLGVLGGRAEPPVFAEVVSQSAVTRSASR